MGGEPPALVPAHRITLTGTVGGNQGWVLLAFPQSKKDQPQLSFLAQEPPGLAGEATRQPPVFLNSFERLLWDATSARPLSRDLTPASDEPITAALLWSLPVR
jgi:hypothetical protein